MGVTAAIGDQAQAGFERSEELAAEKAMEWMRQGVLLRIQLETGIFPERMKK